MQKYFRLLIVSLIFLTTAASTRSAESAPARDAVPVTLRNFSSELAPFIYTPFTSRTVETENLSISSNYFTYQIHGESAQELRDEMDRIGKTDDLGENWDAYTEWSTNWTYDPMIHDGQCASGPVRVSINIHIFFPTWSPPSDASPDLIEKWQTYLLALLQHEEEHKQIITTLADAMQTALNSVPPQPSCQQLSQAINDIAESYKQIIYNKTVAYDQITQHGKVTGASFP